MIPRRYAPSTLAGLRSAQNATGLSLAAGGRFRTTPSPGSGASTPAGTGSGRAAGLAARPGGLAGALRYPVAIRRAMLGSRSRLSTGGKATPLPWSACSVFDRV